MRSTRFKAKASSSIRWLTDNYSKKQSGGYTLFFVLIASSIAATMAVAVSIRAYTSYTSATKKSLSINARNAAESGLAILIESLNRDYPEWLISSFDRNDGDKWTPDSLIGSGCNPEIEGKPETRGVTQKLSNGTTSHYELISYRFNGNEFYGGKGQFVVNGIIRSKNGKSLAEAQVIQEMQIMTKTCGTLPGDTTGNERIWPGMFMQTISRWGYTDVVQKGTDPLDSATILCPSETCAKDSAKKAFWMSDLPPWPPTVGDIKSPDALTPPEELTGIDAKEFARLANAAHRGCKDFVIPDDLPDSAFLKDSEGTTHAYINGFDNISIPGRRPNKRCPGEPKSIKIVGGPVRLYIDAAKFLVGNNTWIDTSEISHAADFMILGTQKEKTQRLDIKGMWPSGETLKTFIWMPKGKVHLFLDSVKSIEGAIWGEDYECSCNKAISDKVTITVPEDMPSLIFQRLGEEFAIGRRDFFAQGTTNWRTYSRLIR